MAASLLYRLTQSAGSKGTSGSNSRSEQGPGSQITHANGIYPVPRQPSIQLPTPVAIKGGTGDGGWVSGFALKCLACRCRRPLVRRERRSFDVASKSVCPRSFPTSGVPLPSPVRDVLPVQCRACHCGRAPSSWPCRKYNEFVT